MRDGHDERGRFIKGFKGNPTGRNGHRIGWQRYGRRAAYWGTTLTGFELCDIVADEHNTRRLSFYDLMILHHLWRSIYAENRWAEGLRLIESIEGPPRYATSVWAHQQESETTIA